MTTTSDEIEELPVVARFKAQMRAIADFAEAIANHYDTKLTTFARGVERNRRIRDMAMRGCDCTHCEALITGIDQPTLFRQRWKEALKAGHARAAMEALSAERKAST